MPDNIRPPAVAGMFYPDNADDLTKTVSGLLNRAVQDKQAGTPKALIVPHAGYIYSGPIAASAYVQLIDAKHTIHQVVLLGPSHRVSFRGLAVPQVKQFATPLGNVTIDQAGIQTSLVLPFVIQSDEAHALEHSLEVHLPFLQTLLVDDFTLIPIVVGDATAEQVSQVIEQFWEDTHTLIVISSDLSHYHAYAKAKKMDTFTSHAIEQLQPEKISYDHACGRIPILGLLNLARQKHLKVKTLDLRNSGDTAGDKSRVVGYGAYGFYT